METLSKGTVRKGTINRDGAETQWGRESQEEDQRGMGMRLQEDLAIRGRDCLLQAWVGGRGDPKGF